MLIELQQKREGMAKRLRWYKEELERVQSWIETEEYAIKAIDAEIANAKKVDQLEQYDEDKLMEAREVVEDERHMRTNNGEGM